MGLEEIAGMIFESGTPEQKKAYNLGTLGFLNVETNQRTLEAYRVGVDLYLKENGFGGIVAAEDFIRENSPGNRRLQLGFRDEFDLINRVLLRRRKSIPDKEGSFKQKPGEDLNDAYSYLSGALLAANVYCEYLKLYSRDILYRSILSEVEAHRDNISKRLAEFNLRLENPITCDLRIELQDAVARKDYLDAARLWKLIDEAMPAVPEAFYK